MRILSRPRTRVAALPPMTKPSSCARREEFELKQSSRFRVAPRVLMALLAACAVGMGCGEQALRDGSGLEDTDIQLDPIPDEINCTVVENGGEPSGGVTLVCRDGEKQKQQQQIDCPDILSIVGVGGNVNKCLPKCSHARCRRLRGRGTTRHSTPSAARSARRGSALQARTVSSTRSPRRPRSRPASRVPKRAPRLRRSRTTATRSR